MEKSLLYFFTCILIFSCGQNNSHAQNERLRNNSNDQKVGGRCEGCEAVYESKILFDALNEIDTLPIFSEEGPKLVVSGTVYKSDGQTPAAGVVIYVYHTDQEGKYRVTGNETGWGKRHGTIRGWIKTNTKGQYKFYTIRPASYSKTGPPAHIHTIVKEPGKTEYWIDDFLFDDDPFLTSTERNNQRGIGGNGIVKAVKKSGVQYAERDIYLGKNVEGYPLESKKISQLYAIPGLLF